MGMHVKADLVIPPNPGDLSDVNHLTQSTKYKVELKRTQDEEYTECFVYETDNYAGNRFHNERRQQQSVSFTYFSFADTSVDVKVTCNFEVDSVTIRPKNFSVIPKNEGNVIMFTLNSHKKISLEVNDRRNPLFIFADAPDIPDEKATYYFGPGVHQIGKQKMIRSGESVYIAAGAIVQGTFKVEDFASNVSIRGRGIINVGTITPTNDCGWISENCTISAKTNNHLKLEGLILTNAAGWTISVTDSRGWDMPKAIGMKGEYSFHNQYRNLKLIAWNGNSDGIWFDGDDAVIDDCFIFNNDDGVTTHGSNRCKVSNIVFWGGPWGRFFMHNNWASSSDLTFENINIIGKERAEIIGIHGNGNKDCNHELKNFTFKNMRIEEHDGEFIVVSTDDTKITNMTFENVVIDTLNEEEGMICPGVPGCIKDMSFVNFKAGGKHIKSLEEIHVKSNENVKAIHFV